MLNIEETTIIRKVANLCELAGQSGFEPIYFLKQWLSSSVAQKLYMLDFKEISQSKQYLLHSLILEKNISPNDSSEANLLYWAGYVITAFEYTYKITPKDFLENYELSRILKSYDTLHTLSTQNAVREIKENYNLANSIRQTLFKKG